MTKSFALVNVGHVDFDNRNGNALDTIAQGITVVTVSTGIEYDGITLSFLQNVDKFAFVIGLHANNFCPFCFGISGYFFLQRAERIRSVKSGIAFAEHVHVYTV